jgi:AMMECR1 domain-containing protein|tara:strand:+ start:1151 stop:2941 length:1791 start_codon:yes stop_codon:yes gene_type:complete
MKNLVFIVVFVVFVAVIAVNVPNRQVQVVNSPGDPIRVEESLTPAGLNLNEKRAVIAEAYAALDSEFGKNAQPPKGFPIISNYYKVFITFIGDNQIRCCQSGKGKDTDSNPGQVDISTATERCIGDDRFGGETKRSEVNDTEITVTYLYNKREIKGGLSAAKKNIELGVHSFEIAQGSDNAYYKASVAIKSNLSHKKALKKLCKKAGLSKTCYDEPGTKIHIYDTVEFKGNRKGEIVDLSRQNILFDVSEISEDMIDDRVLLSRDWFKNNVNHKTGLLEYMYYPSDDDYSDDNNHVRQIATLWSVATLRNHLKDSSLNNLISRSLDYYLEYIRCEDDYCYLEIKDTSKLAYNAFMIMALLEAKEYPNSADLREKFAKGVLNQQEADGSYRTYFNSDRNSGVDFYPGEAMLAIMMHYQDTKIEKYKTSVENAFPYYRKYWRKGKNTAFIPWHTQVYRLLYEENKDKELAEFIFEMTDWIIKTQQALASPYEDEVGGFPPLEPRYSTSAYAEGLNDAYAVARLLGDNVREARYKDSVLKALRFVLLTQYIPENSFYLKNPEKAIGGFRKTLTNNEQRIDCVQHAVFALLKALENGVLE